MIRGFLGGLKRTLQQSIDDYRFPYKRITRLPANRPSVESVYYYINQLGKHLPVGLTHNVGTGYHELPFPSLRFKTSRDDLQMRLERLKAMRTMQAAYGLDIGCAIGGLTFGLQQMGANMVGIDRDRPCIDVASECEALFKTGAHFECDSFGEEALHRLRARYGNPATGRFDFAIWFSSFNWVAGALGDAGTKSLLRAFSEGVDELIADSAIGGKGSNALAALGIDSNDTFQQYILSNSSYTHAKEVGSDTDWYGRNVYLFSKKP